MKLVWTTLIIGYFTIDYQLVRFQLRTDLRTTFFIHFEVYLISSDKIENNSFEFSLLRKKHQLVF